MERSGSVLVVDADVDARVRSAAALRSVGYQVAEAGGCREAIVIADRRPVDLAVLEVDLPDGDGYRLAHRLRAMDDPAVVFLSAADRSEEILAGFDAGADDYILKTWPRRELLARVAAVLRRTHAAAQVWRVGDLVVDERWCRDVRRVGGRLDRDRVPLIGGICALRGHHVGEAAVAHPGVGRRLLWLQCGGATCQLLAPEARGAWSACHSHHPRVRVCATPPMTELVDLRRDNTERREPSGSVS